MEEKHISWKHDGDDDDDDDVAYVQQSETKNWDYNDMRIFREVTYYYGYTCISIYNIFYVPNFYRKASNHNYKASRAYVFCL